MLMSARQPGLAKVFNTTLGFDGDEFYTEVWPEIKGERFNNLLVRFRSLRRIQTGPAGVNDFPEFPKYCTLQLELLTTHIPHISLHVSHNRTH
jgi:hypothetical protein